MTFYDVASDAGDAWRRHENSVPSSCRM